MENISAMFKFRILNDRKKLLFLASLFATFGLWFISLNNDWHAALTPAALSGLFGLLANNVFTNAIKNMGIFSAGETGSEVGDELSKRTGIKTEDAQK
jgi:hypothetical protein